MARMYRCYNCLDAKGIPGRDFTGETPVCPSCSLDGTPGKHHAQLIVTLRTMHYDPPHPTVKNRGVNIPLCGANRAPGIAMTGDPKAANCPRCKASPDFAKYLADYNVGSDDFEVPDNFVVKIDIANEQLVKAE